MSARPPPRNTDASARKPERSAANVPFPGAALLARLPEGMASDEYRLGRRIEKARHKAADAPEWGAIAAELDRSIEKRAVRAARKPAFAYPPELPVAQRAAEIERAIRQHQVVIVCGETGSGKTTQLPKICLAAGRGERGLIGHTQPRRIAARAVAQRIAEELGQPVGGAVGYKVRFTDQTQPDAYIKLMTDGILLAETQGDRELSAYDTIILDEAHERSLNIDFLLGYLTQLLARRRDLKLIITSATIDAERFAAHFGRLGAVAPVFEVSGRTYPIGIRYRPLKRATEDEGEADDEEEMEEAIVAAAEDLWRQGPGDILVFLPGEREIRETAELLQRGLSRRPYAQQLEILPLFARLSVADQQRVFAASTGRRIVLATNVAETSLTVPGIRYVIDTGLARVKRYSVRNKTTLLQIENIARSAANQRAGRCGRMQDGICVRLFDEEEFAARPAFTEPEILRSSLAAVVLRMAALDLGPVDAFPFLEPPPPRAVADGYQLLQELSAVDAERRLTPLGRELARLPLDPRIGRIVLAARAAQCLPEALVIASALAVPDPRERPFARTQAADQAHLRFRDERSDFLALIALWEFFAAQLGEKQPHRRLVDACRAHFVSYLRLREWRDVHQQLVATLRDAGWNWTESLPKVMDKERYARLHQAVLAGLLGNIGVKADADSHYQGARGLKFYLHPGSGLAKKGAGPVARSAKWILAAELTETTRLYARCAAAIEPEWIEQVAGDRVTRDYFDAHWDERRGEVVGSERVSLYGLTLVARRPVSYGRIDAQAAHDIFIREALVGGKLATKGAFLAYNQQVIADVAELEHKARRQDVLVDDEVIARFYAERMPADVCTLAGFESWRTKAEAGNPQILHLTREYVMRHAAAQVTVELFPETLPMAGTRLPLKYRFTPGHPLDGLTLTVPLPLLNRLDERRLGWLVPGMIRDKVTHYLKALPKAWRNRLIPPGEVVTAFLESPEGAIADTPSPASERNPATEMQALPDALRRFIKSRLGDAPPADVWDQAVTPAHLLVNIVVQDAAGNELATGRDIGALRAQLGEAAQMTFARRDAGIERSGMRGWDCGDLPDTLAIDRGGETLTGYPALVDDGDAVSVALLDTPDAAQRSMRGGVLRLMQLALREQIAQRAKGPPSFLQAALLLKTTIPTERLREDALAAICDRAFLGDDPLPRSAAAFAEQVKRARTRLPAVADGAFAVLAAVASEHVALTQALNREPKTRARLTAEIRAQRDALVYPGFMTATPWAQLAHLPRYLAALSLRLAKFGERPDRDARHAAEVAALWDGYVERRDRTRANGTQHAALESFRWLLEELRVSLFAQELKTPVPVSFKRLAKAWRDVEQG